MTAKTQSEAATIGGFGEISELGRNRGSTVLLAVVRFCVLLAAGLLSGAVFGAWLMERSFGGGGSFYTQLKQLQIPALTVPLSSLGVATVALGLIYVPHP